MKGKHFETYADHESLQYISNSAKKIRIWARWLTILPEFDFNLSYIPDPKNLADGLSRCSEPEKKDKGQNSNPFAMVNAISIIDSTDPKFISQLKEGYLTDPDFSTIYRIFKNNEPIIHKLKEIIKKFN